MNCFFQQTGHEEFICLEDPKDCTEKLPNEIYAIYSKFYIHAQSVCFYAKSALWSSKVDELINSLVQTSDGLVQTAWAYGYSDAKFLEKLHLRERIVSC